MLCFAFAILVVVLDQFIKLWIVKTLALHETAAIIPGLFGLTNVQNTGAAFSILADQRWLLVGIACFATLFLIAILLRYNDGFWGTLGLAAVLGGTMGNLLDRILQGYIVDMFELYFVEFAVFNIADIFITLGGITFLVYFIVSTIKPSKGADRLSASQQQEHLHAGHGGDEDQIGLYDFQYTEDTIDRDPYKYISITDNRPSAVQPSTANPSAAQPSPAQFSSAHPSPVHPSPVQPSFVQPSSAQPSATHASDARQSAAPGLDAAAPEPDISIYVPSRESDAASAIEALSELELGLEESDIGDYDIDELLREYGFEDDTDQEF